VKGLTAHPILVPELDEVETGEVTGEEKGAGS